MRRVIRPQLCWLDSSHATPAFFSAFISAVVTEWIGASVGLGYLVTDAAQYFKLPLMWAAIFTAAGLTLVLLGLVTLLERVLWRWTGTAKDLG